MDVVTYALSKKLVTDTNTATGAGLLKFWTGTAAEYAAIATPDASTIYIIKAEA